MKFHKIEKSHHPSVILLVKENQVSVCYQRRDFDVLLVHIDWICGSDGWLNSTEWEKIVVPLNNGGMSVI